MDKTEETSQQCGVSEGSLPNTRGRVWNTPQIIVLGISSTASGPVAFITEDAFFGFGGNMNPDCDPTMAICTLPNTS
jgi:hypothetical protein